MGSLWGAIVYGKTLQAWAWSSASARLRTRCRWSARSNIGSKGISSAQALAEAVRGHWGIENRLHWMLDVTFREDECRVRTGHAPRNLSTIRKFALTLLRQDQQYPKRSMRSRRKTADRLTDYRESLLDLQPRG